EPRAPPCVTRLLPPHTQPRAGHLSSPSSHLHRSRRVVSQGEPHALPHPSRRHDHDRARARRSTTCRPGCARRRRTISRHGGRPNHPREHRPPHGDTLERTWSYTGDLTAAHLIAVTPQGDVFVGGTDDKLRRYDLAGKLTGSFASPLDYFLAAMTAAPNAAIHVADQGSAVYSAPGDVRPLSRDGDL